MAAKRRGKDLLVRIFIWGFVIYCAGFFLLPSLKYTSDSPIFWKVDSVLFGRAAYALKGGPLDIVWRSYAATNIYWCRRSPHCRVVDDR